MVRQTVIAYLCLLALNACSEKKVRFYREAELFKVLKELNIQEKSPFVFMVVRTNRCDLCTEVTRDLFNNNPRHTIALLDAPDTGFHPSVEHPGRSVKYKDLHFFESRGIDFSENYLFILDDGEIRYFNAVTRETKGQIAEKLEEMK